MPRPPTAYSVTHPDARRLWLRAVLAGLALTLTGCAGWLAPPPGPPDAETGLDGVACVGPAPQALPQLAPAEDAALLAQARLPSGQGGVCAARVYSAREPLRVYRVFDAARPWTAQGRWWALQRPAGPRDSYRALNAICPEWSALDRLVVCEVKSGATLVLGTTQSAQCQDQSLLPKTAQLQVYLANDARAGVLQVADCREEGAWP